MHNIRRSVVQTSWVMFLQMDLILMKFAIAFWTFDGTCLSKDNVLSRSPPNYFTLSLSFMRSGPALGGSRFILVSCCHDLYMIYSVISEFNFEMHTVHPFLDVAEVNFMICFDHCSCLLLPAKKFSRVNDHQQIHWVLCLLIQLGLVVRNNM